VKDFEDAYKELERKPHKGSWTEHFSESPDDQEQVCPLCVLTLREQIRKGLPRKLTGYDRDTDTYVENYTKWVMRVLDVPEEEVDTFTREIDQRRRSIPLLDTGNVASLAVQVRKHFFGN
jgi:hypothetical protein